MPAASNTNDDPIYYTRLRKLSDAQLRERLSASAEDVGCIVYAAAAGGSSAAQVTLGQMLLDGHGMRRDPEAASRWFGIAAAAGDPDGINMLGRCFENGWGGAVDRARAMNLFRKAAAKSHAWAQFNLGMMLMHDRGHLGDAAIALTLFVRSARQGNAKAMNMIGRFREFGWTCRVDLASSERWSRRAAERGCFRGAAHLARLLFERGRSSEAECWYRRSIAAAPVHFCRDLAAHLLAREHPALQGLAREALRCAAEAGEARDLFAYGCVLAQGLGGAVDRAEATVWLHRAQARGIPGALGILT
ncbi:tetratricopeptide repeat protein [Pseudorhodoplanes sp.]|uniref:tetratricopeptide repeat protein n=1 Tax=Pseudorhodoplanes sp. TaxID=1934341 RepID=UPI003D1375B3